jgi:hypothetical protein
VARARATARDREDCSISRVTSRLVLGSLVAAAAVAFAAPGARAAWNYEQNGPHPEAGAHAAAPAGTVPTAVGALEQREARVDQLLHGRTGARDHTALVTQKQRLQGLIDKMQAGQQVDPSEIDQLMNAWPR